MFYGKCCLHYHNVKTDASEIFVKQTPAATSKSPIVSSKKRPFSGPPNFEERISTLFLPYSIDALHRDQIM